MKAIILGVLLAGCTIRPPARDPDRFALPEPPPGVVLPPDDPPEPPSPPPLPPHNEDATCRMPFSSCEELQTRLEEAQKAEEEAREGVLELKKTCTPTIRGHLDWHGEQVGGHGWVCNGKIVDILETSAHLKAAERVGWLLRHQHRCCP